MAAFRRRRLNAVPEIERQQIGPDCHRSLASAVRVAHAEHGMQEIWGSNPHSSTHSSTRIRRSAFSLQDGESGSEII
jgi:hypothetical protein